MKLCTCVNLKCSAHGKAPGFFSADKAKKELRMEEAPQETTHRQGNTLVLAYELRRKHTPWVSCPLSRNGTDPTQSSLGMQENISGTFNALGNHHHYFLI